MRHCLHSVRWAVALILAASLAAATAPQDLLLGAGRPAGPSVMMAEIPLVKVKRGRSARVVLPFRVADGFHVNSSTPSSELLIPTALTLAGSKPLVVKKPAYSPGKVKSFPFAPEEKLSVYEGPFQITVTVAAPAKAKPGTYLLSGELKYQACDDRACYPPKKLPVEVKVEVTR